MARMLIVYRTPTDEALFDDHYFNVHVPMAKKLPGLRKYETSKGPITALAGASDTYLIATLHFDTLAAIQKAFASDVGQACGADRRHFAPDDSDVQMFLFDEQEV